MTASYSHFLRHPVTEKKTGRAGRIISITSLGYVPTVFVEVAIEGSPAYSMIKAVFEQRYDGPEIVPLPPEVVPLAARKATP